MVKKLIAFDPGKHCGWALFENGIMTQFGTLHGEEEIYPWIGREMPRDLDLIVIEDYKIRDEKHGGFDHIFQSVFPAQVIGAIKFFAYNCGIPTVLQQSSLLNAACPMITGKPYVKKANRHHWDAFLHGAYWLKKNPNGIKYE